MGQEECQGKCCVLSPDVFVLWPGWKEGQEYINVDLKVSSYLVNLA